MPASKPLLILLAGPNGAGKSTFHAAYLSDLSLPFLNADFLSRETGLEAYAAAREIGAIRGHFVRRRQGFIFETVLSDPVGEKVAWAAQAAEAGFDVQLIFLGLNSAALSKKRVRDRVEAGGHEVPAEKLNARYRRTLDNLERSIEQLPRVTLYDNSEYETPFRFVAEFRNGKLARREKAPLPAWTRRFVK